MKTLLISAASTFLMLSSAFAREAAVSPILSPPGASTAAERRVAQIKGAGEGGIPCMTYYILTRDGHGWYLRKEVDCEE
jgi:hypothetical protein